MILSPAKTYQYQAVTALHYFSWAALIRGIPHRPHLTGIRLRTMVFTLQCLSIWFQSRGSSGGVFSIHFTRHCIFCDGKAAKCSDKIK